MKPLIIYHANCADGFGAAFAAWIKLESEAEYVVMKYGEELDLNLVNDREVYILDFSFPREVMDQIFHRAKYVVWLDHHKTAFEMWCGGIPSSGIYYYHGKDFIHLDNERSGARLAWSYFHPNTEIPMLIRHIDDYDRWQFKIDGTKEFNKALWSYAPWSFTQWQEYISPQASAWMIQEGAAILRAHNQNVQSVVKGGARKCFVWKLVGGAEIEYQFDLSGLAACCPPHLTSDVGHELANQSKSYGLCWTLKKEGMIAACSLRSNGDYDVSAIAKAFGGGGHRNAAGFEVPIKTLLGWMK